MVTPNHGPWVWPFVVSTVQVLGPTTASVHDDKARDDKNLVQLYRISVVGFARPMELAEEKRETIEVHFLAKSVTKDTGAVPFRHFLCGLEKHGQRHGSVAFC
jgi:hypothetical protein